MFGIEDPGVWMAYLLSFLCVLFAIVYGILNWNKGMETDEDEIKKDLEWEEHDQKMREEISK